MADKKKPSGWVTISSENWKLHILPASFAEPLRAEMAARGSRGKIVEQPIQKAGIDRGGMCFAGRPFEDFRVAGLLLGMPSERLGYFRGELEKLQPRRFGRRVYYKLHAHWNCVLLTSAMRRRLLAQMAARQPVAEARSDAFYEQMKARQATKH